MHVREKNDHWPLRLDVNTSNISKKESSIEENGVILLIRKFKNFLRDKKKRFDQKKDKDKIKNSYKAVNPIWYGNRKSSHIKWKCPSFKKIIIKTNKRKKRIWKKKKSRTSKSFVSTLTKAFLKKLLKKP